MTNVYTDQGTACSLFECLMIMSYTFFFDNVGAPWSSGAWGPGPNGPVVNPPLVTYLDEKIPKHYKCTIQIAISANFNAR